MIIVQEIQAKVSISMLTFSRYQASKKRPALGMRKAGLRSWLPVEGGQGSGRRPCRALTRGTHLPVPAWAAALCILGSGSPGCARHSSPCRGATWRYLPRVYFFLKHICRRNVVQLLSHVQLFVTPWTAARGLLCSPRVCSN